MFSAAYVVESFSEGPTLDVRYSTKPKKAARIVTNRGRMKIVCNAICMTVVTIRRFTDCCDYPIGESVTTSRRVWYGLRRTVKRNIES